MKTGKNVSIPQNDFFDEDELPDGWELVNLSQISELIMGQSPPGSTYNTEGVGVPFFQGKADFTEKSPVVRIWCSQPKKLVKSGDILISVRAPVGPTNIADQNCAIGRGLAGIRPKNGIPIEYILYYLKFKEPELALSGTGSTFTAIKKENLANLLIPLPPLAEQQRIVARVEALLTHVNAARYRLSRVPLIMKKFRQAVLAAASDGRLTEGWREKNPNVESGSQLIERIAGPDSHSVVPYDDDPPLTLPEIPDTWEWSRCFPLCDPKRDITYGVIKLGAPIKGGIPTLRSSDVRWLHIDNSDVKTIDPNIASQYSRTFLRGGEIVITVRGSLGGIAIVPQSMAGYNISREVAVLPIRSDLDAKYFCYAIASIWSQNWLSEVTKGVAYTGFNIRDLKRLPLPLPPLAEQHEIVRRVGLLFEHADAFDQEVVAAGRRCERLTQAVLGKAFSGKL